MVIPGVPSKRPRSVVVKLGSTVPHTLVIWLWNACLSIAFTMTVYFWEDRMVKIISNFFMLLMMMWRPRIADAGELRGRVLQLHAPNSPTPNVMNDWPWIKSYYEYLITKAGTHLMWYYDHDTLILWEPPPLVPLICNTQPKNSRRTIRSSPLLAFFVRPWENSFPIG